MHQTMLAEDASSAQAGTDAIPFQNPEVARVSSAFLELDEEHRIVLSLHYFEQLSIEEVALVLDDTEENVREVYLEAIALLGGQTDRQRDAA